MRITDIFQSLRQATKHVRGNSLGYGFALAVGAAGALVVQPKDVTKHIDNNTHHHTYDFSETDAALAELIKSDRMMTLIENAGICRGNISVSLNAGSNKLPKLNLDGRANHTSGANEYNKRMESVAFTSCMLKLQERQWSMDVD